MAYNIIFYFSDQQRWDTCGCFGQPLNITPNLDKLAAEGVKFDNAFSPPVRFDVAEVTPLDSGRWMVHIIKGAFTA